MRVLVTGVGGQLGYDVVRELERRGHEGIGSDIASECLDVVDDSGKRISYEQLDITDGAVVQRKLAELRPDAVVHCAGWTAVDKAEEESLRETVWAVNARGTENLALACRELSCKMMYISTDYVFDGRGEQPWLPDCRDYKPLSVYGETKLAGEQAVSRLLSSYYIVRIAWAFGVHGGNFVKTMLDIGRKHEQIRVVNDQIGTPTYTYDLARLLVDMIETDKYGYYHATNEGGYISWYDFAVEIFRQAGYGTQVLPVTTEEYGASKAARPYNSRLDKRKLAEMGFELLPDWKDALGRYLREVLWQGDKIR